MRMGRRFLYCLLVLLFFCPEVGAQEEMYDTVIASPADQQTGDDNGYVEPDGQYEREEFNEAAIPAAVTTRKVNDGLLREVRSDDDYWYANEVFEKKKKEEDTKKASGFPDWLKTVLWILIVGGFVAILIWFLSTSNIRLFRKTGRIKKPEASEEEPVENIFELNFDREIAAAIDVKNYRLAVRLYYLQMLRRLSEKNLISYTHEKTNSDYLFQLSGSPLYKTFFRLTRNFEYVWYGKFEISEEQFRLMQQDFQGFKQQAGS